MNDLADRLDALADESYKCLCGRGESCEECSPISGLNLLRDKLRELAAELRGKPIRPKTLDDYRRCARIVK